MAPKPVQSFWVTPSGEERFQVWSGPGQAHSFCDQNGGEVGIDLVAHVKDVPDRPGWANAFVLASLFESTSGTCGGSDNDGNANTGWFMIAPGATEQRHFQVHNEHEGGDYADVTISLTNRVHNL